MKRAIAVLLAASATTGCARTVTFYDSPIVWKVNDDENIPEPGENLYITYSHYPQIMIMDPIDRGLSLADEETAHDINALDEVPDSTWFENRIGRFDLKPEDVARGPGGAPPKLPLVVTKGKSEGSNSGFFATDADGRKFLIKLDLVPEMRTGNTAFVSRLFWAMGYHVPKEHVFSFKLTDLRIDPKAKYDKGVDEDLPFGWTELKEVIGKTPPARLGEYRALASELLPGKPKGGFRDRGRRSDDPNDTIDHEHRRSLRGLQVFATWLDHSDIGENNTIDMYVEEDGRRFIKHHLMDFGETLGAHAVSHAWVGYQHVFDYEYQFGSLFTLGFWKRPWEGRDELPFRTVGPYFPDQDPELWREKKPYLPFRNRTAADAFWAAKIIMRFSRAHIEAAMEQGKFTDPAAKRYLVDTIMTRRRLIGLEYMNPVTAFDHFRIERDRLCMTDLSVFYRLASGGYLERVVDGDVVDRVPITANGTVCVAGPGAEPYVRYELRARRKDVSLPAVEVHVKGGETPRVLGIVRDF